MTQAPNMTQAPKRFQTPVRTTLFRSLAAGLSATVILASLLASPQVEAKRLGGGQSVGKSAPMQRQATPAAPTANPAAPAAAPAAAPNAAKQPAAAPAQPAPAAQQPARNRWLGPIAGLAAGLGLAALASHFGFGEGLANVMMIALLALGAVLLVRLFMARKAQPELAGAGAGVGAGMAAGAGTGLDHGAANPDTLSPMQRQPWQADGTTSASSVDEAELKTFLDHARQQFLALQKAWDAGQIDALREFCTPALMAEFEAQHQARGGEKSHTSLVSLDLEWLGMSASTNDQGEPVDEALIRFFGLVRESVDGMAESFDEVWTLQRRQSGQSGWLLAGITQQA